MGMLHKDLRKFMVIFNWILLMMRNTTDKLSRKDQNTHAMFNISFSENRVFFK